MNVTLALLLCLTLQQALTSAYPRSAQKTVEPATKVQRSIAIRTPFYLYVDSSEIAEHGKSEEEKREDAYEKGFDHAYKWATIAGVIGGWCVLLIVRKQGQAIINAERAWVMAELDWAPMFGSITATRDAFGQPTSAITMRLRYRNDGNTPAWVDEIKARFEIVQLPNKRPDIKTMARIKNGVLPYGPIPLAIGGNEYVDFPLECIGQEELRKINVVYGVIYYRDTFNKKRRTFFGFQLKGNDITYLPKFPEYNKHT